MLEVGALTTITPAWVAALTSTLSSPTPARATTLRRVAAASASASTLVAERTRIASTSRIAASSSARSAPLQVRISKSGPSASMVAGLSSSAMSTTGLTGAVTAGSSWWCESGLDCTTLCCAQPTPAPVVLPNSPPRRRPAMRNMGVMDDAELIEPATAAEWGGWLAEHHTSSTAR